MSDAPAAPAAPPAAPATPPAAPATPPTTPPATPPAAEYDWRSTISDEAIRNAPALATIKAKDANEFTNIVTKQLVNAQKMLGAEKVLRPKADWTPEQTKQWYKDTLNIPDTADAYKIDLTAYEKVVKPEGLTELKTFFAKNNFSQAQAEAFTKEYYGRALANQQQEEARLAQQERDWDAQTRTKWGQNYQKNMDLVDYAKQRLPESMQKLLQSEPGLAKHPAMLDMLQQLGAEASDDNVSGAMRGNTAPTPGSNPNHPVEIQSRLNEIENDSTWLEILHLGGLDGLRRKCMEDGRSFAPLQAKFEAMKKERLDLYKRQSDARKAMAGK